MHSSSRRSHDVSAVLPENATSLDVFRAYPNTARPLVDYHQVLLRGPSPLTVAERESDPSDA